MKYWRLTQSLEILEVFINKGNAYSIINANLVLESKSSRLKKERGYIINSKCHTEPIEGLVKNVFYGVSISSTWQI